MGVIQPAATIAPAWGRRTAGGQRMTRHWIACRTGPASLVIALAAAAVSSVASIAPAASSAAAASRPAQLTAAHARAAASAQVSPRFLASADANGRPGDPPIGVSIDTLSADGAIVIAGQPVAGTAGAAGLHYALLGGANRDVLASGTEPADKAGIAKLAQ